MDVIIPLPGEEAHVYFDEGSGTYQLIARGSVQVHHDHLRLDLKGLKSLAAKDREALLGVREDLLDGADEALRSNTKAAILVPPGQDERVIRLDSYVNDLRLSTNRVSSRAARLAEIDQPFEARKAKDAAATARLLGGETARILQDLLAEADRAEEERDALLKEHYPYVARIATPAVAARLLSIAGGIRSLATAPASRIQLLGAEAALFRHLKNPRQRPPKHGVLHEHPLMQEVPPSGRGKLARTLADKIAIAARVDYFGEATDEQMEGTWREIEATVQQIKR